MPALPAPYDQYANEFTQITGLDPKKFPDTFIQFIQAKRLEEILKQQAVKLTELIAAVRSNLL